MSFMLPNLPSPRAKPGELADFAELKVLLDSRCSSTDLQRYLGRLDDNEFNEGIRDKDDEIERLTDSMTVELGDRRVACPDGYPFQTDKLSGSIILPRSGCRPDQELTYKFLLFATRFNMLSHKVFSGIDGTELMEEVCAVALQNYLGRRSYVNVFGTARRGSFSDKVSALCQDLKEGGRFTNITSASTHANDDGLDVVGWLPFSDRLPSKICVFGQCKTGTYWKNHLTRLDPSAFVARWMSERKLVVDPLKAYFIAESADRADWKADCLYCGILFDRCRIVDLIDNLGDPLRTALTTWTEAAHDKLRALEWS